MGRIAFLSIRGTLMHYPHESLLRRSVGMREGHKAWKYDEVLHILTPLTALIEAEISRRNVEK
jgi:hypothetical protein